MKSTKHRQVHPVQTYGDTFVVVSLKVHALVDHSYLRLVTLDLTIILTQ